MNTVRKPVVIGAAAAAIALAAAVLTRPGEGLRHTPYADVGFVLTVCNGHTGKDVQQRTYSDMECEALLQGDLADADQYVRECIPPAPLQVEAALTDATYNIGPRVVCGSAIQKRARAGDWRGVCDGLLAWVYAGGRKVQGLLNRRNAERTLCLKGIPQ